MHQYQNFDLENIVTPVDVGNLRKLLMETHYDEEKSQFLLDGFQFGFALEFEGKLTSKVTAPNLKFRIGNEVILWNKVMKEVKEKRYAGPYLVPPYEHFIQSPIGLVPKDGGKDVRLIFHLSYPRTGDSVNSQIPKERCKVKYCEFDDAVKRCIQESKGCSISRSDMKAAFRNLGMRKQDWPLLLMKARNPSDGKWYYFVDKCLPFGASISCKLFQEFSNAIAHVVGYYTKKKVINYIDDYLFAALLRAICNAQVETFLSICEFIRFPVSMEKTFWGCTSLTFLGLLIDTVKQLVCIPTDKVQRAIDLIEVTKKKRKVTLHELQKLCGYLNFLCRAVVPGRAFTRRLYAYTK